jgi:hypothetical protein
MHKKKIFAKLFMEKFARREGLSLMNRAFSAGWGYTFGIKIAILQVKMQICEISKYAF